MAKKAFVYDGTNWIDIAQSTADLSNYANMTTTPISGFRNAIINGDFRIWQRGTSFSSPANGTFVSDRWVAFFDGTGATRTFSQQLHTLGAAPAPGYEGQFFLRCNQSVAGTGGTFNEYNQKIESVRTFAGQTVTVSFWAKAASTTVLPSLILRQEFGTGGSPSTSVNTTVASSISVGTSWTRFTYTTTLPSLSGKTIGTSGTDNLTFILALPLNSTFTVDIWGVQVEQGTVATPFERRPISAEIALCQRYYEKSYNINVAPGTNTGEGAYWGDHTTHGDGTTISPIFFKVTKRITPSSVTYISVGGTGGVWDYARNGASGQLGMTNYSPSQNGLYPYMQPGVAWVPVLRYGHWIAEAEL
jgi:hypothetical protein